MLNDNTYLKKIYTTVIGKCGAEIRSHQEVLFKPEGLTFTFILSESHVSCHTYPNYGENGLGVLLSCIHTCGEHVNPEITVNYIIKQLQPTDFEIKKITRGVRGC